MNQLVWSVFPFLVDGLEACPTVEKGNGRCSKVGDSKYERRIRRTGRADTTKRFGSWVNRTRAGRFPVVDWQTAWSNLWLTELVNGC